MNLKKLIDKLEKLRVEFGDNTDVIVTICEVFSVEDDRNDYYHADDGINRCDYNYQKKAIEIFAYLTDWD